MVTFGRPAVESDVPPGGNREEHGGGGEGGETCKLPLTHHTHPEPLVRRGDEGEGEEGGAYDTWSRLGWRHRGSLGLGTLLVTSHALRLLRSCHQGT